MLKRELKLLDLIIKNFKVGEIIFFDSSCNSLKHNQVTVPLHDSYAPSIISKLAECDFLSLSNHPNELYFSLTYDGLTRRQRLVSNFIHNFLTRYIPGFISGVAATVLSQYLLSLFP